MIWDDPYAVLGLPFGATQEQVANSHKRLAFDLHPDRNGGSTESTSRLARVNAAYERVKDEAARETTKRELFAHLFGPKETAPTRPASPKSFTEQMHEASKHADNVTYAKAVGFGLAADFLNAWAEAKLRSM